MFCATGIVLLLTQDNETVDWAKIADFAESIDGLVTDLCSGELAVIGPYLDDPNAAYTDRWSIRFGSVLSAIRFEVRPYFYASDTQRRAYERISKADPTWVVDRAQRVSKLMAECEPFAHTLEAIFAGGPVRQEVSADISRKAAPDRDGGASAGPGLGVNKQIPKAAMLAYASLEWVERMRPGLTDKYSTLAELRHAQHEYIRESGDCPAYLDSKVPTDPETWAKHIRVFQRATDGPSRGIKRPYTRSVAPAADLPRRRNSN